MVHILLDGLFCCLLILLSRLLLGYVYWNYFHCLHRDIFRNIFIETVGIYEATYSCIICFMFCFVYSMEIFIFINDTLYWIIS